MIKSCFVFFSKPRGCNYKCSAGIGTLLLPQSVGTVFVEVILGMQKRQRRCKRCGVLLGFDAPTVVIIAEEVQRINGG